LTWRNLKSLSNIGFWSNERASSARARVALSGLTVAEFFRDETGADILYS